MAAEELASRRSRRSDADAFRLIKASLLVLGGGLVLSALFVFGRQVRLDSLLVLSATIFNIISGLQAIGGGIGLLSLGLAQALGLFALSLAAMVAVLAVVSGLLRVLAHALPGLGSIWQLMAKFLNAVIGLIGFPHALEGSPVRQLRGPLPLAAGRRPRSAVPMREAG
jgi:hypothetical protein